MNTIIGGAVILFADRRTDWNLQARVTWEFQPNWRLVGGVDAFNGPRDGLFGRFDDQDRVYGEVRYDF